MSIETNINEMAQLIRHTREFRELQNAKETLSRKPELVKSIKSFQENERQLYQQKISREEMERRMGALQKEFDHLQQYQEVNQYFKSVQKLNELIYDISQRIFETLENDVML